MNSRVIVLGVGWEGGVRLRPRIQGGQPRAPASQRRAKGGVAPRRVKRSAQVRMSEAGLLRRRGIERAARTAHGSKRIAAEFARKPHRVKDSAHVFGPEKKSQLQMNVAVHQPVFIMCRLWSGMLYKCQNQTYSKDSEGQFRS